MEQSGIVISQFEARHYPCSHYFIRHNFRLEDYEVVEKAFLDKSLKINA
jgi:hypothetical protein